jgi:hypothetical protein
MNEYAYETTEFGLSDEGIHLLRSRFNYETIPFSDVQSITIERGKELNNWILILLFGVALITVSLFYILRALHVIGNYEVNVIYIEQIVIPVIPLLLGCYCLYSSTRNGTILRLKTVKNKKDKFPLKEIEKTNSLSNFQQYLKERLSTRIKVIT